MPVMKPCKELRISSQVSCCNLNIFPSSPYSICHIKYVLKSIIPVISSASQICLNTIHKVPCYLLKNINSIIEICYSCFHWPQVCLRYCCRPSFFPWSSRPSFSYHSHEPSFFSFCSFSRLAYKYRSQKMVNHHYHCKGLCHCTPRCNNCCIPGEYWVFCKSSDVIS